jgi:hypothetical protein
VQNSANKHQVKYFYKMTVFSHKNVYHYNVDCSAGSSEDGSNGDTGKIKIKLACKFLL